MNDAIGHAGTYDPTVHYFHCQKTVKVIFLCRTLHLMRDVIPPSDRPLAETCGFLIFFHQTPYPSGSPATFPQRTHAILFYFCYTDLS